MNDKVKVSVVIPVYNASRFLHECIDSILNQTLKEIEVICVDDGSTDNSLDILREYEKKDSRVKILTQKNQFAGAARNAGLNIARGEYVHFLDADDYVILNAYELLYQNATEFDVDMLKARAHRIDEKTGELQEQKWNNFQGFEEGDFNRVVTFCEMPEKFLRVDVVPWNGIYRRAFLLDNGIGFNGLVCVNDRSFYNEVIVKARRIAFIQDYIVFHRVNMKTSLVGQRAQNFDCHFKSYRIIENQSKNLPPHIRAAIQYNELKDMFSWYKKFRAGEYGEHITIQMRDFLADIDIGPVLKYCKHIVWFSMWAQINDKKINGLMSEDDVYRNKLEKEKLKKRLMDAQNEIQGIRSSRSYRIGRCITFLPRKVQAGIRCHKQHGLRYTFGRMLFHLHTTNRNKKG